jgi:predicted transcriptional regulator
MKSKELTALLERADTWPAAAQKELVELALEIEQGITGEYHATPEELKAIDQALEAVERGEVATAEEVEAVFAKYRRA